MWKQLTIQGNTQYFDLPPEILKYYNDRKHPSKK